MEKTKNFIQRYKHLFIQDDTMRSKKEKDTIGNHLIKNFEIHNDAVRDNTSCNYVKSILGDSADKVKGQRQQSPVVQ